MLLAPERSLCEKNQAIVVSTDKGNSRKHRAINPQRMFDIRQYQLDGDLVKYEKCCDYLLVNDSQRNAYLFRVRKWKDDRTRRTKK